MGPGIKGHNSKERALWGQKGLDVSCETKRRLRVIWKKYQVGARYWRASDGTLWRCCFILFLYFSRSGRSDWDSVGRRDKFILTAVWRTFTTYFIRLKIPLIVISALIFEMLKFGEQNEKGNYTIFKCHQLRVRGIPISEVLQCEKNVHLGVLDTQNSLTGVPAGSQTGGGDCSHAGVCVKGQGWHPRDGGDWPDVEDSWRWHGRGLQTPVRWAWRRENEFSVFTVNNRGKVVALLRWTRTFWRGYDCDFIFGHMSIGLANATVSTRCVRESRASRHGWEPVVWSWGLSLWGSYNHGTGRVRG